MDKKEKYKVTNINYAIWGTTNCFQFGTYSFRIYDNCTSVNSNYLNDDKNYYDLPSNYGLTGGDATFTISSYEVYHVEY